jgi:DNA processing protein
LEELEALLILTGMPYLGSIKIRLLIQRFGSALKALQTPPQELGHLPGFGPKILDSWNGYLKNQAWKKNLELIDQLHAQVITYLDPLYPKRLLELTDFPIILYVNGNYSKQDQQRCLAVVGTRHASLYGSEMARQISRELAHAGFTIISGLARGIDTAAHLGALEAGRTLAIMGSGLAHIYPAENKILAQSISRQGAILSEFSMCTPPDRTHFPQRNRIVSGMSMGTILIEAPQKSGAMLTANKAIVQGRPVFVLPGRADIENFRGNHQLIKSHKVHLIENSQDVIHFFDELIPKTNFLPKSEPIFLEIEETYLMERLTREEFTLDELQNKMQMPIQKLNVLLMSLVLKKAIKEYPGKIYKKI